MLSAFNRPSLEFVKTPTFQLGDECNEDLVNVPTSRVMSICKRPRALVKLFVSAALKNGNFPEGFRLRGRMFLADCRRAPGM